MLKKLFHFEINRETYLALAGGIVVILLSALLRFDIVEQNPFLAITVRDLFMILGIGVIFVLLRIQKADLKKYGLSLDKWKRNIIINIILASLLAFIMIKDLDTSNFTLSTTKIFEIIYIFIAGIFEVLFFYTYQRVVFERSFGKIPAIILVAVFYSLHHIGFQPEFLKLFFVGISYVAVVLLTNNALSIFPFYWGVGATLDVLIQSQAVSEISYPAIRSSILAVLIVVFLVIYIKKNRDNNAKVIKQKETSQ